MWKLGEVEEGPRWEERQAWLPGQRISARGENEHTEA